MTEWSIKAQDSMPTWDGFMAPVLRELEQGATVKLGELCRLVADRVGLTPEQRSETLNSGQLRFRNRIGWATSYLNRCGALERPTRGHYKISDEGRKLLRAHPEGIAERDLRALAENPGAPNTWAALKAQDGAEASEYPETAVVAAAPSEISGMDPTEQVEQGIELIHSAVADDLLDRLQGSDPSFFESAVVKLLLAMGYGGAEQRGQRIGGTGDGGVDGVIDQDPLGLDQVYVQAKRYASGNTISRETIQAFVGALAAHGASKGVFITTSAFSWHARDYASMIPTRIILIDARRLTDLMIKYKVGAQVTKTYEVVDLDEDFFE